MVTLDEDDPDSEGHLEKLVESDNPDIVEDNEEIVQEVKYIIEPSSLGVTFDESYSAPIEDGVQEPTVDQLISVAEPELDKDLSEDEEKSVTKLESVECDSDEDQELETEVKEMDYSLETIEDSTGYNQPESAYKDIDEEVLPHKSVKQTLQEEDIVIQSILIDESPIYNDIVTIEKQSVFGYGEKVLELLVYVLGDMGLIPKYGDPSRKSSQRLQI